MYKEDILTFEELLTRLKKYIKNKKELELIKKAYMYAYEKHFGQKRKSGEDYIIHPLNVAYILAGINADYKTICSALLHDTIEDCDVTKEEIEELFGGEVAYLVESLTKINKLNFSCDSEATIANQRKILVGLTEDVRVIILKLADRLHNMRTLWALPEKKQKENAKETLDIFIPIAHRLGMNSIKSELEDLCLRYSKPDVYFQIVEKLNKKKSERDEAVNEMKNTVSKLLNSHNIKHEIKGRSKSIYSIYKKLDTGRSFNDIYDFLALRVFVKTEEECYQVLGIIHSKFKPIPKRFKDYIAMPKTNMYQSLHTSVFGNNGEIFEIQIRTYEMDKIAENGIASHWSYKEKKKANLQSEMEQKLQFFRLIMELKHEGTNDQEFVDSVKEDVLKDTIYVFTPQGDVLELPNGSTPIDFAYRVHTRVGDTMVGAIVNNNIVPLDYKLKDDDIVKINTNKNSPGPSREWLNIAKTTHAKNKIRSFFNKNEKEDYVNRGEDLISKELRKRKLSNSVFNENLNKILQEFKCSDLNDLYINVGNNKYTPSQIVNLITGENTTKEELLIKKTQNKEVSREIAKNDIIVEGIDDIKVNIASCCKPIKDDEIIGYITKGYGITIHRINCPNVSELQERFISVRWNSNTSKKYPTTLLLKSLDSKNMLFDIIAKTTNRNVVVESINNIKNNECYTCELTISVDNLEQLNKFINDLESIPNMLSVERLIK
ncbi:MAG: bifunctional (p)ppGpp synthetase/guanosine-3',5'-bis(diphosphate) 3'-pyrophosphohydrolase [Acholeplasma sp.]|nr:bifunctional (p)ppGpp synthetase/guanosine-3',5'-bis(diphosphate) 3'-pyrophosphohydrolase [Acholeplasma sp.]CCY28755.1 relA/SpoT family protein [Acholeplasma sp. CAG:878]